MFQSLRHKILLVVAVCAAIALLGFFALYWLTLEQNRALEQHQEMPAVSIKWFKLNNAVHRATLAQKYWLDTANEKFLQERDLVWNNEIHPAFEQLGLLYKKSRVWEEERSVERRAFYDLRLMILSLENLQQKANIIVQINNSGKAQLEWSTEESPLVLKISKQVEIMVRWQTDFAQQQASELQQGLSRLGIWIWIVAFVVLLLVLVLALFFAKRISAPLLQLRSDVQQVINEQDRKTGSNAFKSAVSADVFSENEDEVKKLTEIFQIMEDVIRERTELLEFSNRQLDEASRAKGMYLTNMSHELRTPLNAIIGFTEVLLESEGAEKLSAYHIDRLGRILKSGRHLLELINSLLDLSKIEAGQMEIQQTNFPFENLLHEVMEGLEPLLLEKSLEQLLIFQDNQQFLLFSDSSKVRQVLINILGNAIKFTEPGGRIEIRCTQDENGIDLAVKDTGCGMSEEEQQHIFKVFHQVKATGITPQKGTGLGLALVQSLMELLEGTVSLKSTLGVGSTFTLHFPVS